MSATLDRILGQKLIAVLRLESSEFALAAAEAVSAGGIEIIEVTMTTPGALDTVRKLALRPNLVVGAGTVMDTTSVRRLRDAGASFCASPVCDPRVVQRVLDVGMLAMPGALTPTEIRGASALGADVVKLFPMPQDAVGFLRALRGPLPNVRMAPSGGVTSATAAALLHAGASALFVGSWLTHDNNGLPRTLHDVRDHASALVSAVHRPIATQPDM